MTSTTEKYTLVESAAIFGLTGIALIALIIATAPLALLNAWIRLKLWDWFAVPYLHLPHISIWVMWGLGLFALTFSATPTRSDGKKKTASELFNPLWTALLVQLAALAIGFTIHHFIQ